MTPLPKCGAKTRAGTPCKYPAGRKTDHVGEGKCHLHGGDSPGAQKGNKNAVRTGEFETLHLSALSAEERLLYEALPVDPKAQAESNLRLASIREHRILLRINRVIEESEDGFGISSITTHNGWNVKGKVDFSIVEKSSTLDTVMRLEDALTRVQALKAKTIEQLRNILTDDTGKGEDRLGAIVAAIDRSALALAPGKEEEDG